ncbi:TRAP transporter small permease subunit [Acuticoccus sp. M5D2P5]|uniref:TRAP transporter small permease n=1 Tax=Acuticoccus kalidii TaxID=2910977 RepID=UPI001F17FD64|nr:TRAP transporter small permease [Acuticoccus kalidii]MCF3933705.1 TRAP transporter small permease subunit [Acuticoccus kalidii]
MRRTGEILHRAEAFLAAVLLLAMVVLIFAGGVARMMATPLNWTIDFATCFFAWATFLAADVAWRRDALMSVDLVPKLLPARWRSGLQVVNVALIIAFLVFLVIAGAWLTWVSRGRSFQGIPEISFSFVTASLPVGALLLLVTTIGKARRMIAAPSEAS